MFSNYLKSAIRILLRHKLHTLVNLTSLTLGLVCFIIISLSIKHELSFDDHLLGADDIYRVNYYAQVNDSEHISAQIGAPIAKTLLQDYPQVTEATRVRDAGQWIIKSLRDNRIFKEKHVLMADSNVFSFFGLPLIYGKTDKILTKPNTLAIDLSTSEKMYGDLNPIGKVVELGNGMSFQIDAVYEDIPLNTHFHHNVILSMSSFAWTNNQEWLSTNFNTYIKLQGGVPKENLEGLFPKMIETYCGPLIQKFFNKSIQEFYQDGNSLKFSLIPVSEIHLHSDIPGELEVNGDIVYVYMFSIVAVFVLILACINYINLSTASYTYRIKEIGVRKTFGAQGSKLMKQFLSEAVLICVIAFTLALVLSTELLPFASELVGQKLNLTELVDPLYAILLMFIVLITGILAGFYPAMYMSALKPTAILQQAKTPVIKDGFLRNALVIFQFSISMILVISTVVIFNQLNFIQQKNMGYDKEQVLLIKDAWLLRSNGNSFINELSAYSNILTGTLSSFVPTENYSNSSVFFKNQAATSDKSVVSNVASVDHRYLNTLGLSLSAGEFFSKESRNKDVLILNQAAVKKLDIKNPVGSYLYTRDLQNSEIKGYKIIGIVNDFHYNSLRNSVEPMILRQGGRYNSALIKLKANHMEETLQTIESEWNQLTGDQPFEYEFLDDQFARLYAFDLKIGRMLTVFAVLTIIIACLGLFGLAVFTTEQRMKEIGIRLTLGATSGNIVFMLSKNLCRTLVISLILAIPASSILMNHWLDNFAYRISIDFNTYLISGLVVLVIAWATIMFQSYRVAGIDPIKILRQN